MFYVSDDTGRSSSNQATFNVLEMTRSERKLNSNQVN